MKKNQLNYQPISAPPRLVRCTRQSWFGKISQKYLRTLPAMAVILILSTLVIYLTAGTYTNPLIVKKDSKEASYRDIIKPDFQEFGKADYQEFLLLNRSKSLISTATATGVPEVTALAEAPANPTPTNYPRIFDAAGVPQEGMPTSAFTADNTVFYVKENQVNIRIEPNTSSAILVKCVLGDKLTRLGYGLDWSQVKSADGKTGYVLSSLITTSVIAKPTPSPTPSPTPKPTAKPTSAPVPQTIGSSLTDAQKQSIIDLAKSCIGVRYVYGGMSMNGFDCSGFTSYVYKSLFRITLPRSARDQAHAGIAVSRANIQVGDIICFDWDSPYGVCDHVGLYIGGGQYIHAAHSKGRVLESTLKSTNPVVSIRRIIR